MVGGQSQPTAQDLLVYDTARVLATQLNDAVAAGDKLWAFLMSLNLQAQELGTNIDPQTVADQLGTSFFADLLGYPHLSMVVVEGSQMPPNATFGPRTFWVMHQLLDYDYATDDFQNTIYRILLHLETNRTAYDLSLQYIDQKTGADLTTVYAISYPNVTDLYKWMQIKTGWTNTVSFNRITGQAEIYYEYKGVPAQNGTWLDMTFGVNMQSLSQELRDQLVGAPNDRLFVALRTSKGLMVAASHGLYFQMSDKDWRQESPTDALKQPAKAGITCLESTDLLIFEACLALYTQANQSWLALPLGRQEMALDGTPYWVEVASLPAGLDAYIIQLNYREPALADALTALNAQLASVAQVASDIVDYLGTYNFTDWSFDLNFDPATLAAVLGSRFFSAIKGYPHVTLVALEGTKPAQPGDIFNPRTFWLIYQDLLYDVLTNGNDDTIYASLLRLKADNTYDLNVYRPNQTTGSLETYLFGAHPSYSSMEKWAQLSTRWDNELSLDSMAHQAETYYELQSIPAANGTWFDVTLGLNVQAITQSLQASLDDPVRDRLFLIVREPYGHILAATHGEYFTTSDVDWRKQTLGVLLSAPPMYDWTCLNSTDRPIQEACAVLYTQAGQDWTKISTGTQQLEVNGTLYQVAVANTAGLNGILIGLKYLENMMEQVVQVFNTRLHDVELEANSMMTYVETLGLLNEDLKAGMDPTPIANRIGAQFFSPILLYPNVTLVTVEATHVVPGTTSEPTGLRTWLIAYQGFLYDTADGSENATVYTSLLIDDLKDDLMNLTSYRPNQTTGALTDRILQLELPRELFARDLYTFTGWVNVLQFNLLNSLAEVYYQTRSMPAQNDTWLDMTFTLNAQVLADDLQARLLPFPASRLFVLFRTVEGTLLAASNGKYYSASDVDWRSVPPQQQVGDPLPTAYTCLNSTDELIQQACFTLYALADEDWRAIPLGEQEMELAGVPYYVRVGNTSDKLTLTIVELQPQPNATLVLPPVCNDPVVQLALSQFFNRTQSVVQAAVEVQSTLRRLGLQTDDLRSLDVRGLAAHFGSALFRYLLAAPYASSLSIGGLLAPPGTAAGPTVAWLTYQLLPYNNATGTNDPTVYTSLMTSNASLGHRVTLYQPNPQTGVLGSPVANFSLAPDATLTALTLSSAWVPDVAFNPLSGRPELRYELQSLPAEDDTWLGLTLSLDVQVLNQDLLNFLTQAGLDRDRLFMFVRQPSGRMIAASHGQVTNASDWSWRTVQAGGTYGAGGISGFTCLQSSDGLIRAACEQLFAGAQNDWLAIPVASQAMVLNGSRYQVAVCRGVKNMDVDVVRLQYLGDVPPPPAVVTSCNDPCNCSSASAIASCLAALPSASVTSGSAPFNLALASISQLPVTTAADKNTVLTALQNLSTSVPFATLDSGTQTKLAAAVQHLAATNVGDATTLRTTVAVVAPWLQALQTPGQSSDSSSTTLAASLISSFQTAVGSLACADTQLGPIDAASGGCLSGAYGWVGQASASASPLGFTLLSDLLQQLPPIIRIALWSVGPACSPLAGASSEVKGLTIYDVKDCQPVAVVSGQGDLLSVQLTVGGSGGSTRALTTQPASSVACYSKTDGVVRQEIWSAASGQCTLLHYGEAYAVSTKSATATDSSSNGWWVIVVAVVLSVAGAAVLALILWLAYRRHRIVKQLETARGEDLLDQPAWLAAEDDVCHPAGWLGDFPPRHAEDDEEGVPPNIALGIVAPDPTPVDAAAEP